VTSHGPGSIHLGRQSYPTSLTTIPSPPPFPPAQGFALPTNLTRFFPSLRLWPILRLHPLTKGNTTSWPTLVVLLLNIELVDDHFRLSFSMASLHTAVTKLQFNQIVPDVDDGSVTDAFRGM
jgi:hypothetical protein